MNQIIIVGYIPLKPTRYSYKVKQQDTSVQLKATGYSRPCEQLGATDSSRI